MGRLGLLLVLSGHDFGALEHAFLLDINFFRAAFQARSMRFQVCITYN